ncbi:MAG: hypothetical protein CMC91_01395 [Flavobacteriaceae bacterium]|nr:hypothetical protein [Flavobacteriaceae bacterium]|tara:strand:+ start:7729 stop:8679 length:951 start_codon:yes stop_codon:yes gene_type:complete
MIANLFEKTTYKAYLSSLIFSFFTVFFIQFCKNYPFFSLQIILNAIVFWAIFVFFILMITYLETRYAYSNYSSVHLLAFPLTFLFFPHGPGLVVSKIFLGLMLVYSKYVYGRVLFSENSAKNLFDLSFIFSLILIYNNSLAIFYLIPLAMLLKQKYRDMKHFVCFVLPVTFVPLFINAISIVIPEQIFGSFYSFMELNLWDFTIQSNSEFLWGIIIILSVYATIFYKPKVYQQNSNPENISGFNFMSFWLYASILLGILGLHVGAGRWFLSFIPSAYFIGIFFNKIRSRFVKNYLISFSLIAIIIFKLIDFKILNL